MVVHQVRELRAETRILHARISDVRDTLQAHLEQCTDRHGETRAWREATDRRVEAVETAMTGSTIIQDHSTVKLDLLGRYLREYLRIVGGRQRGYGHLELTVVDAFCGGGKFRTADRKEADIKGSPLVLLDAAQAVRDQFFEQVPENEFDWKVRFLFNDVKPEHTVYLEEALKSNGHDLRGDDITFGQS